MLTDEHTRLAGLLSAYRTGSDFRCGHAAPRSPWDLGAGALVIGLGQWVLHLLSHLPTFVNKGCPTGFFFFYNGARMLSRLITELAL